MSIDSHLSLFRFNGFGLPVEEEEIFIGKNMWAIQYFFEKNCMLLEDYGEHEEDAPLGPFFVDIDNIVNLKEIALKLLESTDPTLNQKLLPNPDKFSVLQGWWRDYYDDLEQLLPVLNYLEAKCLKIKGAWVEYYAA